MDLKMDREQLKVDHRNLYREDSFTDVRVGTIRRLMPVLSNGNPDKTRKPMFIGHAHLMTSEGPLPVQANIKAKDLPQAIKRFPEAIAEAMEDLAQNIEKLKQKEESRIIVPGR